MSKQKKQHTGLHRVLLVLTSILLVVALAANVAGVYFAETIDNYVTGTHLDTSEKATAAVMETGEKVAEQIAQRVRFCLRMMALCRWLRM